MEQKIVEDPVLKQRLGFQLSEDGEALIVEMWVEPGGGVPPHVHPVMEERFEVISGELSLLSGRKWTVAGPGETVTVPPGIRHAYRNSSSGPTHATVRAAPPLLLVFPVTTPASAKAIVAVGTYPPSEARDVSYAAVNGVLAAISLITF